MVASAYILSLVLKWQAENGSQTEVEERLSCKNPGVKCQCNIKAHIENNAQKKDLLTKVTLCVILLWTRSNWILILWLGEKIA